MTVCYVLCLSVSVQKQKNYGWEIDVAWLEYVLRCHPKSDWILLTFTFACNI